MKHVHHICAYIVDQIFPISLYREKQVFPVLPDFLLFASSEVKFVSFA